ncbi:ribosomal-processing cysteine protease Prp [Cytobacillus sp. FSL W7-1323]|uniref:ribosomal-processing cysteine protease Prp n=1 Tax=Cytobacillus sp. FSL W7-1323 TaxID=2921700 RepID=UPI0031590212
MTQIEVTVDNDGYMKIEANGHTKSVVCASVSTLLQSSVRFLQELSQQYPDDLIVNITQEHTSS